MSYRSLGSDSEKTGKPGVADTKQVDGITYCVMRPEQADLFVSMVSSTEMGNLSPEPKGSLSPEPLTTGERTSLESRFGGSLPAASVALRFSNEQSSLPSWILETRSSGHGIIAVKHGETIVLVPSCSKEDLKRFAQGACPMDFGPNTDNPVVLYEPSVGWDNGVSPWVYVGIGLGIVGAGYLILR